MTTIHEPEEPPRERIPRAVTIIATGHPGRIAAYLAVSMAFVVALLVAQSANHKASRANDRAAANVTEIVRIRNAQIKSLHEVAVQSCTSRHQIVRVLRQIARRGIVQAHEAERGPLGKVPGVRDVEERGIRSSRRFLRELREADCKGVPPLPRSPSPTTSTSSG